MSSRSRCRGGRGFIAVEFVRGQPAKDLVTKPATEGSDRFGLGVAGGHPLGEILASGPLALELGDGDPVEGVVELAVTDAVQPMADGGAQLDRDVHAAVLSGSRS